MKHYHYVITAYHHLDKKGLLQDISEITTRASNEEEALSLAKEMLVRKKYRVAKVWECYEDHELTQKMQMLQLEVQSKVYKLMKP